MVQPPGRPFDLPAPRAEARFAFERVGRFAARPKMGGEAELSHDSAHLLDIGALVQTQALRLLRGGLRTLHPDARDGGAHQFPGRALGGGHRQADRHALAFRQQAPRDAICAAIRGAFYDAGGNRFADKIARTFTTLRVYLPLVVR